MSGYMAYLPPFIRHNTALTSDAKILYAELTSLVGVDGRYKLNYKELGKPLSMNQEVIKKLLNSLYLEGAIEKDGSNIIISTMKGEKKKPLLENVDSDFIDDVVNIWNDLFKDDIPSGIRKTPTLIKTLTERQILFSKEDIITALRNRHDYVCNSDWHLLDENRQHKTNIMIVLRDDDKLQEFLNITPQNKRVNMKRKTVAVKREKPTNELLE